VNGGGWKYVKWSLVKKKKLYAFEIYRGGWFCIEFQSWYFHSQYTHAFILFTAGRRRVFLCVSVCCVCFKACILLTPICEMKLSLLLHI